MHVQVYTKSNCSLCDDGVTALQSAQGRFGYTLELRDIADDGGWFARYRYRVPVVVVDGHERLELRFTEHDVDTAMHAAQRRAAS